MTGGGNGQEKLQEELDSLQKEMDLLNKAATTQDACKEIAKYVSGEVEGDPLINHTPENQFLTPPNTGGACCSLS